MMAEVEERAVLVDAGVFEDSSPSPSPVKLQPSKERSVGAPTRSLSMDSPPLSRPESSGPGGLAAGSMAPEPLLGHHRSVSGYIQTGLEGGDSPSTSSRPLSAELNSSLNNVLDLDGSPAMPPSGRLSSVSSTASSLASSTAADVSIREPQREGLAVTVDRPEKVLAAMDTYVLFRVSTKTSRPDFPASLYSVQRRYSDFVWLRSSLEASFPLGIFPPLPGKHSLYALDRFDPEFVRSRCLLLHFFLRGLAGQAKSSRTPEFRAFLTASQDDWAVFKKKRDSARSGGSKVSETLAGLASARLASPPANARFDEMEAVLVEVQQTLAALEKLGGKWWRCEGSSAAAAAAFKACLDHWAETEPSYRLKKSAAAAAAALGSEAEETAALAENHEADLTLPLRHWALAAEAVRAVLRRRAALQGAAEAAWDAVRRREAERQAAEKAGDSRQEEKREARVGKAQVALEEARSRARQAQSEAELADSTLAAEWEAWRAWRVGSLAALLRQTARTQVERHRAAARAWEDALAAIDDAGRPPLSQPLSLSANVAPGANQSQPL